MYQPKPRLSLLQPLPEEGRVFPLSVQGYWRHWLTRGSRGRSPETACTVHTYGRGLHVGACVYLCLLSEALGWKMVTKEEEKRGQKDALVTLKPPVHVSVSVSFSQVEFFFPK